jgi:hypothetical protein
VATCQKVKVPIRFTRPLVKRWLLWRRQSPLGRYGRHQRGRLIISLDAERAEHKARASIGCGGWRPPAPQPRDRRRGDPGRRLPPAGHQEGENRGRSVRWDGIRQHAVEAAQSNLADEHRADRLRTMAALGTPVALACAIISWLRLKFVFRCTTRLRKGHVSLASRYAARMPESAPTATYHAPGTTR